MVKVGMKGLRDQSSPATLRELERVHRRAKVVGERGNQRRYRKLARITLRHMEGAS